MKILNIFVSAVSTHVKNLFIKRKIHFQISPKLTLKHVSKRNTYVEVYTILQMSLTYI